ncbi:YIP1 family protein [Halosimplex rubrum]|uniref:YIP1 family protein n=1 Tax=Halosimplex rubrum TaxID=869889 RepID=A0A7D5PB89_9EURY|nr:YIP1 family protein [Halosimplex rubrum]QLH78800.1 YIP1 family protein [Halosimplex rubrum]
MGVSNAVRNPGSYLSRTLGLYRALLTDPERFYEEFIGTRRVKSEFALVLVAGLIGLVGNYLMLQELIFEFEAFDSIVINQQVRFQLQQRVIEPVLGAFLLWVWFGIGMYYVGWLYTTIGTTYVTMKRTAWALFPILIANVIHTAAMAYASTTLDVTEEDITLSTSLSSEVSSFVWSQASGETVVIAATAVAIVFALWTGYIGAYAIKDVRDLTMSEAYKVAAVPTAGYVLYIAYSVFTAL